MKVEIDEKYCKGCLLCIAVCKPGALAGGARRNTAGYLVPVCDDEKCILCGNCEWTCPELAMTVDTGARTKRKEHA